MDIKECKNVINVTEGRVMDNKNKLIQKKLSIEELYELYNKYMKFDFPDDELKKFEHLKQLIEEKKYLCTGFFENDELKSYMLFTYENEKSPICTLDFFAVNPKYRNSGIGSKTIELIKSQKDFFEDGIIGEIEDPDFAKTKEEKEIQEKRFEFYKKNGFILTGIKSVCFDVHFLIIYLPQKNRLGDAEISKNLDLIYKAIFPKSDYEKEIKIFQAVDKADSLAKNQRFFAN